jgi:hypothetical protein
MGNGSSPDKPYCSANQAVSALSEIRNTIVVLAGSGGPLGALKLSNLGIASPIFVLGRSGGSVKGGATDDAGLEITSENVFVQDLRIEGSQYLGVRVQDGVLAMDRCLIKGNVGGVQLVNSSFDIRNTIFVGNTGTKDSTAGNASWSDLRVTSVATGGRAALINDTFLPTTQSSLSFNTNATPSVAEGLLMASDDPATIANTDVPLCCSGTAASLSLMSDDSLTAQSLPCLDKVLPSKGAPDDYLGNRRPAGAISDCGAFEYFAPFPYVK